MANHHGIIGPAIAGGDQGVGGVVRIEAAARFLDQSTGTQSFGVDQRRLCSANFTGMNDAADGRAGAGQERSHTGDVLAARVTERTIRVFIFRNGETMTRDVQMHGATIAIETDPVLTFQPLDVVKNAEYQLSLGRTYMRGRLKNGCFAISGLAIIGLIIASGARSSAAQQMPVEPKMDGQLMLGKSAFTRFCAECHGTVGQGTDKGPTFLHRFYHPGHHGDGSFFIAARKGVRAHHWKFGNMKPVEGVTDAQLGKIVKYVRALQKANGLF
jgi:hypothetical protein